MNYSCLQFYKFSELKSPCTIIHCRAVWLYIYCGIQGSGLVYCAAPEIHEKSLKAIAIYRPQLAVFCTLLHSLCATSKPVFSIAACPNINLVLYIWRCVLPPFVGYTALPLTLCSQLEPSCVCVDLRAAACHCGVRHDMLGFPSERPLQ